MQSRTYWHNDTMNDYRRWLAGGKREHLRLCDEPVNDLVASSLLENGKHSPVLDIDYQAKLIPSTTPGNSHLYLDGLTMSWWRYRVLLAVMAWAGVIDRRYYRHSVRRRMTAVRMPHVSKPQGTRVARKGTRTRSVAV